MEGSLLCSGHSSLKMMDENVARIMKHAHNIDISIPTA
jgi:hypothetical protein